jgi:uncharacterized protein YpmB
MKKKTKIIVAIIMVVIIMVGFSVYQYEKINKPIKEEYRDYIINVSETEE